MATSEVLTQSERGALDNVLRPHLRLEPVQESREPTDHGTESSPVEKPDGTNRKISGGSRIIMKRSRSKSVESNQSRPFSRSSVHQSTAEADNKRRPGVLRRNSTRYRSPSPEPPDPNSEAKSQTIRRMQSSLETWDKQLEEIALKKSHNDSITRSEIEKRDRQLEELTERYNSECETRRTTELERDNLTTNLKNTTDELEDNKQQVKQLNNNLEQYQQAYEELDENKKQLEEELEEMTEQLQKSEGMRRRLNDQVTELQGQLAIEEQRSRFCIIL